MQNYRCLGRYLNAVLGFSLLSFHLNLAAEEVVNLDISGNRGVANCATQPIAALEQNYLLQAAPDAASAKAVLLLLVGGGGKLRVEDGQLNIAATNFLLRSRHLFAAQGFHVATMDAANDFLTCNRGLRNRRTSGKYTKDIQAVADDLRVRYPHLPLWFVGTSRGTIAAAQGAAFVTPKINGLVITSPMTNPVTSTVFDVPLDTITVPTMITTHNQDGCFVTPPAGIDYVKDALVSSPKRKTKTFGGGFPALSTNPCDAITPHGYLGIEPKVVESITDWIKHSL